MKKRLIPGFILILSLLVGYFVLSLWKGVLLNPPESSRDDFERVIRLTPSNPDPYYRLALLYEWEIHKADLQKSVRYLKQAIEWNPLEQQYWLHLAKLLFRNGTTEASKQALKRAIQVFPTGYQGRWVSANLLLQHGSVEEALPHFSYLLAHYPNQGYLVYDVLRRAFSDSNFIVEKVVPKDWFSFHQFLLYLYEIGDKKSAQNVWKKSVQLGFQPNRSEILQHIEFLIREKEIGEAFTIWQTRFLEQGHPSPQEGELITNGGFEKEGFLGGGFDWKIGKVAGAEILIDPTHAIEGRRSLRIQFDGKENVDFHHVSQVVALRPDTDYTLRAQVKAKAVTTKSGVKVEIIGVGASFYKASEPLIGDQEWKEVSLSFRTPSDIKGGLVRFRREKTEKFDRFISGTVWVDNLSLKEKKSSF